MRNNHTTVRSPAGFDLIDPQADAVRVEVELRYDARDPYAVQVCFRTSRAGPTVEWEFARDLLADGMITEAGTGDVTVRPEPTNMKRIELELTAPSGHALFVANAAELAEFLERTYALVPLGSEYTWLDLDLALDDLLSSGTC
ncbi:MAG: SsgA family sporulation/cell division regulator [Pseudonocardiaceae bacterium]